MSDKLSSYVRTLWPVLLGHVATALVGWAEPFGITVDSTSTALVLGTIASALVYALGRRLESADSTGRAGALARWLGKALLSLGITTGQPIYAGPPAPRRVR